MHLTQTGYEQQYQVVGNDGTVKWTGTAVITGTFKIKNTEASATANAGEAIIQDGPSTTTAKWEEVSTSTPGITLLAGKRVASAASVGFWGVAIESIIAGQSGKVASVGSVCDVQCTNATVAVGDKVGGSATAGLVATIAGTTSGTVLGICMKASAVITGTTRSVLVLVVPQ